ncbi:FabD/lysophospholipase-like protein [Fomes fomentarius]|nr:FabD/lysophospholipase-like protein [Fomes fomentarius]
MARAGNGLPRSESGDLKSSAPVQSISYSLSNWSWPSFPSPDIQWPSSFTIVDVQERFSALLLELGLGPASLYDEIVNKPPDLNIHPECEWDAEVRIGEELCMAERAFLGERKRRMKASFARLMSVPESEVDERDLPVVAIAGSGGGFRAMLNTLGSISAARSLGILDCITYTAGVSGSCWALGLLYSGVAGSSSPSDAAAHARDRIAKSYIDMDTLDALTNRPTNKEGILRKAAGQDGTISLVDLYGTLLSSRLYVPSDITRLDPRHLSLHNFRRHVDSGESPLPILSAIQHTPAEREQAMREVEVKQATSVDSDCAQSLGREHERLARSIRWLWYEFTPFEIGCDEIGAWIPSWSLGRQFDRGKNLDRRHYFREVEPILRVLPVQLYKWLEDIVTENERDLGLIHPVLPNQLPNFLKGLVGQLRYGSPPDITEQDTLSFMWEDWNILNDPVAELNIPYYPFLRRNVDCIIALDASADSQDLWFTRAEELAAKRGLRTWPRGATWPSRVHPAGEGAVASSEGPSYEASTPRSANRKLAETQESALAKQANKQESTEQREVPQEPGGGDGLAHTRPLSACEVWIGSSSAAHEVSARLDDLDEAALLQRDGIAVVYIPLMPNDRRVPDFDPFSISTWRREVSPDESQKLLDVAEANFEESSEKIVRLLRAVWMRKRMERRTREWQERLAQLRERLHGNVH